MKTDFLAALKEADNFTLTENGGGAYKSTTNKCVDAFGTLGGMKESDVTSILHRFYGAFFENQSLAMKMLFYMRDIRGGQGMRRVFRVIARNLAFNYPELIEKNLDNFLFYGRGDDLLCLMQTPVEDAVIKYIKKVLKEDIIAMNAKKPCTLLAKWLPSINTSSAETRSAALYLIKKLGTNNKEYRKTLAALRKYIPVVETKMSAKSWDDINFETVPAKASMNYSDAFFRHTDKYAEYLGKLANGEISAKAGSLFPVDIIHKVKETTAYDGTTQPKNRILYDAMWNALPNYFEEAGKDETGICVVDVSGSMTCGCSTIKPIDVALSLGLYCADKCKGPFKNHFITFSANPQLQEVNGTNIYEKVYYMCRAAWEMNTDIEKVFELILNTAIANHSKQEDMPDKLYIISDMQFDACTNGYDEGAWGSPRRRKSTKFETVIETMEQRFAEAGYKIPALVFWNVNTSECGMFQKKAGDTGCCMVSGYSASLFKAVLLGTEYEEEVNEKGEKVVKTKLDPVTIMVNTLTSERYERVYTGVA